ncbi:MAG: hypothetical protein ACM3ML_08935, partial [Micromonosporaceae bacterium]
MRLLIGLLSPLTGTFGGLTRGLAAAGAARGPGHEVAFAASGASVAALRERGERVHELPAPIQRRQDRGRRSEPMRLTARALLAAHELGDTARPVAPVAPVAP